MTALDQVAEDKANREQQAAAEFMALARRIAIDDDADAQAVEAVLTKTGRSVDDLRSLVSRLKRRHEMRLHLATAAEYEAEIRALQNQITAEGQKLEAAKQAHQSAVGPLMARQRQLHDFISTTRQYGRELQETCPDERLTAELETVRWRWNRLQKEIRELRDLAGRLQQNIAILESRARNAGDSTRKDYLAQAAVKKERLQANEQQIEALNAQASEWSRAEAELLQQIMAV